MPVGAQITGVASEANVAGVSRRMKRRDDRVESGSGFGRQLVAVDFEKGVGKHGCRGFNHALFGFCLALVLSDRRFGGLDGIGRCLGEAVFAFRAMAFAAQFIAVYEIEASWEYWRPSCLAAIIVSPRVDLVSLMARRPLSAVET